MSVRIESEVGLREALDGLAREKEILFFTQRYKYM